MSRDYQTSQEQFWAGQFGDAYSQRSQGEHLVASNTALFARMFARCASVGSLIEFGANVGLNLRAIRTLAPAMQLEAIEINGSAVVTLREWGGVQAVHHTSILEFQPQRTWDAVLIKGVLIHIDPQRLSQVYDALYRACGRYLFLIEYYNPSPLELDYRGHQGKLFKRDFAGELLDRFADLRVIDYGFVWRRDPAFPQDDVTWFVLEKVAAASTPASRGHPAL
jgi:pseudaminic acid biosynthesis-associated methylase